MKFDVTVAYESVFEIEAENKEDAKDTALKSFFEQPEVALFNK